MGNTAGKMHRPIRPSSDTSARDKRGVNRSRVPFFPAKRGRGGKRRLCPGQRGCTRPSRPKYAVSNTGQGRYRIPNLQPATAARHVHVPRQS